MFIIGLVFNYKSVHRIYDIIVYNGFVRGNINKRAGKWNLWVVEIVDFDFKHKVSFLCIWLVFLVGSLLVNFNMI